MATNIVQYNSNFSETSPVTKARDNIISWETGIGRFPVELVSYIFLLGVLFERFEDGRRRQHGAFVLAVSGVCRRWREIAISSPLLYQYIPMSERNIDATFPWTRLCLERSQTCPLDISLFWSMREYGHILTETEFTTALNILFPHINRWREFSLAVEEIWPIHLFLTRFNVLAPLLKELTLYNECRYKPEEPFAPVQFFTPPIVPIGITSSLKHIELSGVHLDWSHFPFANLTYMELRYHAAEVQPTMAAFTSMLKASPNITTLILKGSGPFALAEELDSDATITLPSLELLHISFFRNPRQVAFLAHFIVAPNLRVLQLEDLYGADFSQILPMFGSVATGFRSITELTLASIALPELHVGQQAMADLFLGLPLLTQLNVACAEMDIQNFKCLLVPSPSVTLPNLHTLRARVVDPLGLIRFVEGRRNIGKPLSTLILPYNNVSIDDESLSILNTMLDSIQFFLPADKNSDSDEEGSDMNAEWSDELDGSDENPGPL